jgi:formylglycine-generating enzyme required for sulfatase activity
MASNGAQTYNTATIRQLLLAAFTPEELDRLFRFSSNPQLQNVAKEFSLGDGLTMMVDKAISYCQRYVLLPDLLAEVSRANPRQYAHFIEPELHEDRPARPTPEILTITSPIRLDLVRVPAGEFLMGSVMAKDKDADDDELPHHRVHVSEFHIGQYPVTNHQYQAFIRATGHEAPHHWDDGTIPRSEDNHPVANVSWHDAVAFCDWLSRETKQPFRLPTEAEWEKAARGTDGRIYPWGDDPPDKDRCNFRRKAGGTTTIGRYSPQGDSPYGCADMAGNVWEWCQSLYRPYPYHAGDGREDLDAGGMRVQRGGSWWNSAPAVRCACRIRPYPGPWTTYVGFRVARGSLR